MPLRVPIAAIGLAAAMAWPSGSPAQVYRYVDENGVIVLTDKRPDPKRHPDAVNVGCYGTCIKGVDWHLTPLRTDEYRHEIAEVCAEFGVDEALVRAIIHAESWFNPLAVSYMGAQGLMQLMPATQLRFGVEDPFDPVQNLRGGVAYLAELLERYRGDWKLAVAAYNAGESAVAEYSGVPPYDETREYLRRVSILRDRYRARLGER